MKYLMLLLVFWAGTLPAQTVDPCRADIDTSGTVDFRDFQLLVDAYGESKCRVYWLSDALRLLIRDTLVVRDTLVLRETLRDTLVVRDTLVLRETLRDTLVVRDTLFVVLAEPPQPQPEPPPQPQPQPEPPPQPQPDPCGGLGGSYGVIEGQEERGCVLVPPCTTRRPGEYKEVNGKCILDCSRWKGSYANIGETNDCELVPPCEDYQGYGTHKEVDGECVERPCEEWDTPRVQLSDIVGCVKPDFRYAVFCSSESRAILKIFDETLPWTGDPGLVRPWYYGSHRSDSTAVTEETAVADRDNSGYISADDYLSYI